MVSFFVTNLTRHLSHVCLQELACLVENHCLSKIQTNKQSTIPSACTGEGNNSSLSIHTIGDTSDGTFVLQLQMLFGQATSGL